jgi:hypothetical protein
MTVSVQPVHARASGVRTAVMVIVFWILAAALVVAVHRNIDGASRIGGRIACAAAVVAAAGAYVKLGASRATIDHALLVGVTWLVLAIVAEIASTSLAAHRLDLLSRAAPPWFGDLMLFLWIAAPAFFVRHPSTSRGRR